MSSSVPSCTNKPQFGQWLIEQVKSGNYEGLRMIGHDTFRIPWKHNSRKDCSDGDNGIFRAWAVVSGKILDYPSDKAKWKTNFRCALSGLKSQFEQLKGQDYSKDSFDPHKVYRIINYQETENTSIYSDQSCPTGQIYDSTNFILQDMEGDDLPSHMDMLDLNQQHNDTQQWGSNSSPNQQPSSNYMQHQGPVMAHPALQNNILVPMEQYQSSNELQNNVPSPIEQPFGLNGSQNAIPVPVQQAYDSNGLLTNIPVPMEQHYGSVHPPAAENLPALPQIWDLEITIQYRRTEKLRKRLSSSVVQLHYNCDQSQLCGFPMCFPDTKGLKDQKQVQYTERILDSIQRGLILEVCHTGIYGFRQDKCNVFASTSDPSEILNSTPKTLPKNSKVQLLSFETYTKDLLDFQQNKRGSPDYTIYLCFGQEFPDGKPLEKKLIVVKVVPLICRELHERAQMEGASSLQSENVSLQISHNSLYDLINATFCLPSSC